MFQLRVSGLRDDGDDHDDHAGDHVGDLMESQQYCTPNSRD